MLKSLAVISCCYMYELMLKPMGLPNGPAYTPAGLCSQPSCSHGPSSHFRTVQEQSGRTSDVAERNRGRKSRAAANRRGHAIFHRPLPEEEKKRPRAIQVPLLPNMKESSSTQGEPSTSGAVDDSYSTNRVDDAQLFASVPALNQAASYLAQTASYLTQCLPVPSYVGLPEEGQELVSLPPPSAAGRPSVQTSSVELAGATSSLGQVDCSGSPSQENSGQMVPSNVFQNGTSLFQGLVERARKTVRGSADDIGWLQRDPTLPTTEDGTARFLEILESVRKNEHKLPDSVVYLLVPGLFSNHGPLYFVKTKAYFSKMGLACHIAKIHSEVPPYINLYFNWHLF